VLDSEHPDWTVGDIFPTLSFCLRQVVLRNPVGEINACDEFVRKMLEAQGGRDVPIAPIDQHILERIEMNTTMHCVYYLYLDHIGHHLILETFEGKARVFQSFVKYLFNMNEKVALGGYSAKEWTSTKPDPCWSPILLEAHRRWCGGRELSYGELVRFPGLLGDLQRAADAMEAHLLKQLPEDLIEAERKHWLKDGVKDGKTCECSPLQNWINHLIDNAQLVDSIYPPDDPDFKGDSRVYSGRDYDGQYAFNLPLPETLNSPFVAAYTAVAGTLPQGWVYIKLLVYTNWRNKQYNVEGKMRSAGWTVSLTAIPPH
jgi:hypothetical protein